MRSVEVTGALRETDTEHKLSTFFPPSQAFTAETVQPPNLRVRSVKMENTSV